MAEAIKRVQEGIRRSPLAKYCSAAGAYHCPGDLRSRLRPGRGWAYDSYSKVDDLKGHAEVIFRFMKSIRLECKRVASRRRFWQAMGHDIF